MGVRVGHYSEKETAKKIARKDNKDALLEILKLLLSVRQITVQFTVNLTSDIESAFR